MGSSMSKMTEVFNGVFSKGFYKLFVFCLLSGGVGAIDVARAQEASAVAANTEPPSAKASQIAELASAKVSQIAEPVSAKVSQTAEASTRTVGGYGPITTGLVYERFDDEISEQPGYKYQRTEHKSPKGRVVVSRYTDMQGKELVHESTEYDSKGNFVRYTMDQRQIKEVGTMERRGDKLVFTLKKHDSDGALVTETETEDYSKNSVCVDQMIEHLWANWDRILAGEDLELQFAVVSRKETVNFELQKEDVIKLPTGKEALVVRLTSGNFLIRLFVNPVFLTLEKDGARRVLQVRGRMPIKRFKGSDYGDIEGVLKLDHKSQGLASGS